MSEFLLNPAVTGLLTGVSILTKDTINHWMEAALKVLPFIPFSYKLLVIIKSRPK